MQCIHVYRFRVELQQPVTHVVIVLELTIPCEFPRSKLLLCAMNTIITKPIFNNTPRTLARSEKYTTRLASNRWAAAKVRKFVAYFT